MAFLFFLIFLVIVVIGKIAFHLITTGDLGIRVVKRNSPLIAKLASLAFYLGFCGIATVAYFDHQNQLGEVINLGVAGVILGTLFGVLGITFSSFSQFQMGKNWRIGVNESEETELVTEGIYSAIRHPIYTGIISFSIGQLLLVPHPAMLLAVVALYISIELQVRYVEEPYLQKLHGDAYKQYQDNTGRYLPKRLSI